MCVSPFQKWHKQRKAHDDHNVTSDTAIVVGTSFICLCRTDKSVFIHFLFSFPFGTEMPPDTGHVNVNLHLRLFPAVMSSLSSNRLAMLLPNRAWQTRPFEDMCRRQKTCNRKPCTHDNDGCRTSVTTAGKRGFPLVRCAAL